MDKVIEERRRSYIEGLSIALMAVKDFDAIEYTRTYDGAEYVRISDIIGNALYLDVTRMTLAEILKDVARCLVAGERLEEIKPRGLVTDRERKRKAARAFREE